MPLAREIAHTGAAILGKLLHIELQRLNAFDVEERASMLLVLSDNGAVTSALISVSYGSRSLVLGTPMNVDLQRRVPRT